MPTSTLPQFNTIDPQNIETELDLLLSKNRTSITALIDHLKNPTWETFIAPLEELEDYLNKFWAPIDHLHAVKQSIALREAYHLCLPKLTAYHTETEQNEKLFQAYQALAKSKEYSHLNAAQKKVIENQLRDFHLSGVHLNATDKQRYAAIQTRLAELNTRFEENLLDATEHWTLYITDENELAGIPQHVLQTAHDAAHKKNLSGWLLTLDYPCYFPVISYAKNRKLREKIYTAYVTRASDQGPHAGKFDNSAIMAEILQLRHELSLLLGFTNYAELSLATKMAENPRQVLDFLQELMTYAHTQALQEIKILSEFAGTTDGITEIKPWDMAYYSEKLRAQKYNIDDEMLRLYFPCTQVLSGLFHLIEYLYGMEVREIKGINVWHSDVRFFAIYDQTGQLRGQFYLDLFARANKREGAWMDECHQRRRISSGEIQTPIAFLTCNLTPPNQNQPDSLLTHEEVLTLFHEFGHGLHHMLTQIDYAAISGINGVVWDAVEFPSQFMESFAWNEQVLEFISSHHKTREPLPHELYERLRASKNFHSGLHILRQLEFALFDFRLHLEYVPAKGIEQIQEILDTVRKSVTVIPIASFNRFQHGFSHIFAGSYAAGYYSYLWADILACDSFAKFQENGVLNATIGQAFLHDILEQGGTKDAMDLFVTFRGRKPTLAAFLQEQGFES